MEKLDMDEVMAAVESGDYVGFCVKCGLWHDSVEPDARKYTCEDCGTPTVYGAEELLMRSY